MKTVLHIGSGGEGAIKLPTGDLGSQRAAKVVAFTIDSKELADSRSGRKERTQRVF
jgi:hypothetical protein